jgi:hypothetical protein
MKFKADSLRKTKTPSSKKLSKVSMMNNILDLLLQNLCNNLHL